MGMGLFGIQLALIYQCILQQGPCNFRMDQYIDISHMDHVSDLWKIRGSVLFFSSVLIFKMLKQNNINKFHALAIVIFYLLPFCKHCVHGSYIIHDRDIPSLSGDRCSPLF